MEQQWRARAGGQPAPEQRKMIEQMMAQKGLAMGGRGALGSSIRVCVSKEQAERLDMPQREGHCTQEIVQRSASTIKVKFSCAGNPPSSGEGEINFLSPTAYNGRMTVHTQIEGQPERMNMSQTGTWLSDDARSSPSSADAPAKNGRAHTHQVLPACTAASDRRSCPWTACPSEPWRAVWRQKLNQIGLESACVGLFVLQNQEQRRECS
jgi:hypothetical protein